MWVKFLFQGNNSKLHCLGIKSWSGSPGSQVDPKPLYMPLLPCYRIALIKVTNVYMFMCVGKCACTCGLCLYMCVYVCVHVYVCVCTCVYVCTCVCMCVYMHVCKCSYVHMYESIYLQCVMHPFNWLVVIIANTLRKAKNMYSFIYLATLTRLYI